MSIRGLSHNIHYVVFELFFGLLDKNFRAEWCQIESRGNRRNYNRIKRKV